MSISIERRLRRLESASTASDEMVFIIEDDGNRSAEERLRMLGIIDKPDRRFEVISIAIVHPGPQPDGPLPDNVSPYASGNWRYEPLYKEPVLRRFGPAGGPHRPGSEWVREF